MTLSLFKTSQSLILIFATFAFFYACDGTGCDGHAPDHFSIDEIGMKFVRIPAGTFVMGSPLDEPGRNDDEIQHRVTITRDFYILTTEVTQEQWRIVALGSDDVELRDLATPSYHKDCGDDCPVTNVTWENVQLYIKALEARYGGSYDCDLPTEAQWEYAARAGNKTAFANGDITSYEDMGTCQSDENLAAMGWYCYNSNWIIHPVAHPSKQPNTWGLHDMHGNSWEWCSDWYGPYEFDSAVKPTHNPTGPPTGSKRVLRGGGYGSVARYCRSAFRANSMPNNPEYYSPGFRLVCSNISR